MSTISSISFNAETKDPAKICISATVSGQTRCTRVCSYASAVKFLTALEIPNKLIFEGISKFLGTLTELKNTDLDTVSETVLNLFVADATADGLAAILPPEPICAKGKKAEKVKKKISFDLAAVL